MSYRRSLMVLTFAALGLSFAQGASGWGGGSSTPFTFTHNGITVLCTNQLFQGTTTGFAGEWSGFPGNATSNPPVPATVTQDVAAATCFDQANSDDSGLFHLHIVWSIPPTAAGGGGSGDNDTNSGHGNTKPCDPGNPASNCTGGFPSGVTCADNGSGSTLTYTALCGNDPATATGFLTLDSSTAEADIPSFTGPCTLARVQAGNCTLRVGGEPEVTKGKKTTIDDAACAIVFPDQNVAVGKHLNVTQMVFFQEQYTGACVNNRPSTAQADPLTGYGAACHSDRGVMENGVVGFDNVFRPCPIVDSNTHTGTPQVLAFGVAFGAGDWFVNPTKINTACNPDTGNDQGDIKATILKTATFDPARIAGLNPLDPDNAPVLSTPSCLASRFAKAVKTTFDTSGNALIWYSSCNTSGNGLGQLITTCGVPDQSGGSVTLEIDGFTNAGTEFRGTTQNQFK